MAELRTHGLIPHEQKIKEAFESLSQSARSDFLLRLREQFNEMDRKLKDLDRRLELRSFNGERYAFRRQKAPMLSFIVDLVQRLDEIQSKVDAALDDATASDDDVVVNLRKLMALLTGEEEGRASGVSEKTIDLKMLADYRQYYTFEIDVISAVTRARITDVSTRVGTGSGGERYVPFYIVIGTAIAGAYFDTVVRGDNAHRQSGVMLLDEAFEKLDPSNILAVIEFYKSLGLQILMAAPKTNRALYAETMDTIVHVVREPNSRTIALDPVHYTRKAHELLRGANPIHNPPKPPSLRAGSSGRASAG